MIDSNSPTVLIIAVAGTFILAGMIVILLVILRKKKVIQEQSKIQQLEIDHQKKMLRAALESQENERKRIANDLQDDIGMMLMTLRINLNNQVEGPLQELRKLVDDTHESIRRISWDLMPTTMDNFGLLQSTQEMCVRYSSRDGTSITFREDGDRCSLDKDQELLLYRIAQEAITNALKHSNATKVDVSYAWTRDNLKLSIIDNGLGFDFPTKKNKISGRHGLGLYNMENRVALLRGELSFEKNKPSGTVVSVNISLTA